MRGNNENIPKIRFPGFDHAWKQRAINELADRYDNLRVPITASDRVAGTIPYYGANGIQDYVEGFTHEGEFILIAEDGANDLHNYPVQYVNGKVWVNNHAHVLQAKRQIADNKFLMNELKHMNFEPYLVGSGRAKLNAEVLMKISFRVPELTEQTKIGTFFQNIDYLITLHQRKLNHLQVEKKSLLQKMFPKDGKDIPEIRFPGFTHAWKQRKLGNVTDVFDGTHQTPDYKDKGIMFLSVENIKTLHSEKYISEEAFEKEFKVRPEKGDVLMTRIGDIGTANVVETDEPIAYYVSLALLKQKDLNPYFLQASIHSPSTQNEIWRRTLHIAFPKKINKNEVANVPIKIPSREEQDVIGTFFQNIDHLITLHQRKLDHCKKLKKSLLQQMFV